MTLRLRIFRLWRFIATRATALFGIKFWLRHGGNVMAAVAVPFIRRHYVPVIKNLRPRPIETKEVETIWQFWGQGVENAWPLPKACWRSVEKHGGGRRQIIVDMKTLPNYADMPGYIYDHLKNERIGWAHFADILRLNLLKNHGGIWMDSTDFMTAPIPERIIDEPFFVFHAVTMGSPFSFIQNCFIRAKQGAFLLDAWHEIVMEYWRRENKALDYFQHQLMFKAMVFGDRQANKFYLEMPKVDQEPTHRFTNGELFQKFDADEWRRMTGDSFFQKLSNYNWPDPIPKDSYLTKIISGKA